MSHSAKPFVIENVTNYVWMLPTVWLYPDVSETPRRHHEQRVLSHLETPSIDMSVPFAIEGQSRVVVNSDVLRDHCHWRLAYRGFVGGDEENKAFDPARKPLQLNIVKQDENSYDVYVERTSGTHPLVSTSSHLADTEAKHHSNSEVHGLSDYYHQRRCKFYGIDAAGHVARMRPIVDTKGSVHATVDTASNNSAVAWITVADGNLKKISADGAIDGEVKHRTLESVAQDEKKHFASLPMQSVLHRLMQEFPGIGDWPLQHFLFVGSHDSAAYEMFKTSLFQKLTRSTYLVWSTNQSMNVYEQLKMGCRFLDIRVDFRHKRVVIVHGPVTGVDFSVVLADVKRFLDEQTAAGTRDIVLVKFQAEGGLRKNLEMQKIIENMIFVALGDHHYKPPMFKRSNLYPLLHRHPRWDTLRTITNATTNEGKHAASSTGRARAVIFTTWSSQFAPSQWLYGKWINTSILSEKLTGLHHQLVSKHSHLLYTPADIDRKFASASSSSSPSSSSVSFPKDMYVVLPVEEAHSTPTVKSKVTPARMPKSHVASLSHRQIDRTGSLYNLQWTLTANFADMARNFISIYPRHVPRSILDLTARVHCELHCFLGTLGESTLFAINIMSMDYVETIFVQELTYYLMRLKFLRLFASRFSNTI